jgi:hypothetical protein
MKWKIGYWYEFTLGGKRIKRLVLNAYSLPLPHFGFYLFLKEDNGVSMVTTADVTNVIEIGPDIDLKKHQASAVEEDKIFSELARRVLKK